MDRKTTTLFDKVKQRVQKRKKPTKAGLQKEMDGREKAVKAATRYIRINNKAFRDANREAVATEAKAAGGRE